jgi:hypothetical protein
LATSRRTIATTLTGIAFASLLLAGGTAGASSGGGSNDSGSGAGASSQTTDEACEVLKAGVQSTLEDLQAGLSDISTDPAKAAEAVGTLAAAFEDTTGDVTNDDVRTVADDATNALNDFSEQITAYAADPESADQTAVTDSASAVQSAMTKVGATCP